MSEVREFPQSMPEASQIYREIIKPDHAIAVVGAGISILMDSTLLLASTLINSEGKLYVVDPFSKNRISDDELSEKVGGKVAGIGNVDRYLDEIAQLKQFGIQSVEPEWLGADSGAQSIHLPDDSLDVIVDHNTSIFLAGLPDNTINTVAQRKAELEKIYKEYRRVIKSEGKLLLQTDNKRYDLGGQLFKTGLAERVLTEVGFQVVQRRVIDIIDIPIEGEFYRVVSQTSDYDFAKENNRELLWYLNKRLVEENGRNYLRFNKPDQPSPDFYISTKRAVPRA